MNILLIVAIVIVIIISYILWIMYSDIRSDIDGIYEDIEKIKRKRKKTNVQTKQNEIDNRTDNTSDANYFNDVENLLDSVNMDNDVETKYFTDYNNNQIGQLPIYSHDNNTTCYQGSPIMKISRVFSNEFDISNDEITKSLVIIDSLCNEIQSGDNNNSENDYMLDNIHDFRGVKDGNYNSNINMFASNDDFDYAID
jgi:hypothetical protein